MAKDGEKDGKPRPDVTPERAEEQEARRGRLAAALRGNLRKRKSRQRELTRARDAGERE